MRHGAEGESDRGERGRVTDSDGRGGTGPSHECPSQSAHYTPCPMTGTDTGWVIASACLRGMRKRKPCGARTQAADSPAGAAIRLPIRLHKRLIRLPGRRPGEARAPG